MVEKGRLVGRGVRERKEGDKWRAEKREENGRRWRNVQGSEKRI